MYSNFHCLDSMVVICNTEKKNGETVQQAVET
jgi:hypothetical protein